MLAVLSGRAAPDDELPPELAALLAAQPRWSTMAAVEAGFGYKDNLLLSSAAREESEFYRYGADVFFWRLPRGRTDFSAFLNAQETRYTSGTTVDNEAQAFAQLEWRYRFGERMKFALGAQGYYLDEVFDVSDTEIQRLVAELKVRGATLGPTIRWSILGAGWLEGQAMVRREKYDDGANDSRIGQGALRLGWARRRVEVSVGAEGSRRRFDRREQYSAGGQPHENTLLVVEEQEGEARVSVAWDAAERWKSTARVSALRYRDNGSGFFNYHEKRIAHELEWNAAAWKVAIEGAAIRHDFDVQTVGFGITPPPRVKDEFDARLRVERKISFRWTGYLAYRWERSRSNDRIASYRVNEGLLGARWSWEK